AAFGEPVAHLHQVFRSDEEGEMRIFGALDDVGAAVGADPDIDAAQAERGEGRLIDMDLAAEHGAVEFLALLEVAARDADMREGHVLCWATQFRFRLRSVHGSL